MTNPYQQQSINLKTRSPTTFYIRNLSDLDAVAPADETGARTITTEEDDPGIELRIEGQITLPDGQFIIDNVARGDQQGVTFTGRSANLDGLRGNTEGGLIRGTNGANIRRLRIRNSNALGWCIEVGSLINFPPMGIPQFRTSSMEKLILEGIGGGIRFFTPGTLPLGSSTIGTLVQDVTSRCNVFGLRFENQFVAGVRIEGFVNIQQIPGLEVIQFAIAPPVDYGPFAIRSSTLFASTGVPGEVRGIVFDDAAITSGGNFAIEGCGFEVADPADAIFDNLTAAAVVPGAGSAVDLISAINVIIGSPPVAIASNP